MSETFTRPSMLLPNTTTSKEVIEQHNGERERTAMFHLQVHEDFDEPFQLSAFSMVHAMHFHLTYETADALQKALVRALDEYDGVSGICGNMADYVSDISPTSTPFTNFINK